MCVQACLCERWIAKWNDKTALVLWNSGVSRISAFNKMAKNKMLNAT